MSDGRQRYVILCEPLEVSSVEVYADLGEARDVAKALWGEHVVYEITRVPEFTCRNCGDEIARSTKRAGWTHVGNWQGVRCNGALTGAVPAESEVHSG
ncbi:MAG TPA: hypothetical protein VIV56_01880 [Gemmatimonadales bacterium]